MTRKIFISALGLAVASSAFAADDSIKFGMNTKFDFTPWQENKVTSTAKTYKEKGWELGETDFILSKNLQDNMEGKIVGRYHDGRKNYPTKEFYLAEANLTFNNILPNLHATIGKIDVPFAEAYSPVGIDSYIVETANVDTIAQDPSKTASMLATLLGQKIETYGATLKYDFGKMGDFALSVFENADKTAGTVKETDPDTGYSQSYAGKLTLKPLEGLRASVSYMNEHNGVPATTTDKKDRDSYSAAFKYDFSKIEVFAEYVGGKDFNESKVAIISGGAGFKFTEKYALSGMYESYSNEPKTGTKLTATKIAVGPSAQINKDVKAYFTVISEEAKYAPEKTKATAAKFRLTYSF